LEYLRKRPLRRYRLICEGNVEMDFKEVEFEVLDWIKLAQDRDE